MNGIKINGKVCFSSFKDAADFLGCSVQTIRRYADQRQTPERRMRTITANLKEYLPVDEVRRFRDEIRPTFRFGGKDGRKPGSKDKKPRKKSELRKDISFLFIGQKVY